MDKRLSIVHIDTARTFRGGQEALLLLARALRERGHAQRIASPQDSPLAQRAREQGFDTISFTSAFALRQYMRQCRIAHSHSGRDQTISFLATTGLPVVRVTTRHVAFEPRHPMVHRLKYTSTCDGIIAVSNAVRSTLLNAGIPEEKVAVIPNGIEVPARRSTAEEHASARLKYGFAKDHFVAGHLGAFTPEKGQDVAMEAAGLLEKRLPQLRVILAGDNPSGATASLNVVLPGFVANREEFFAALDLFIMPSRSEGWGLAAAEALAHGVPVVASATGGLTEIVESGETGWLVEPGSPAALADAIGEAASDPDRLLAMGEAARQRAKRFSAARTGELTEAFYRRIVETS